MLCTRTLTLQNLKDGSPVSQSVSTSVEWSCWIQHQCLSWSYFGHSGAESAQTTYCEVRINQLAGQFFFNWKYKFTNAKAKLIILSLKYWNGIVGWVLSESSLSLKTFGWDRSISMYILNSRFHVGRVWLKTKRKEVQIYWKKGTIRDVWWCYCNETLGEMKFESSQQFFLPTLMT